MEERSGHLTVVVGASAVAEELRRALVQSGVSHAGVTTHLRGLRKSIVLGEKDLVVVCIALDAATLKRHGSAVQQLLADHKCFPNELRTVGLLTELGLTREAAQLGCDVYVQDSKQAADVVDLLAKRSLNTPGRRAAEREVRSSWTCGTAAMPAELATLMMHTRKGRPKDLDGSGRSHQGS